jgi:UDP-glucose 4-epimerase
MVPTESGSSATPPRDERRTILVTGGAGHVGSHLIELLVADPGNRVISLDNYSNGRRENHIPGADYRYGHTKDILRLVPETPHIVYHLGEYARIATSFADVATVFDFNMLGTFAVAEFCRQRGVKLVYAASSTKFAIEGDGRHQNPYSFTKATNVDLINDYGRWYGLSYAICYFYNAFGPREVGDGRYATVVAKFEQAWRRGEPLQVVAPGTQRRAFTYVKDLARGIAMVGERGTGDGYALRARSSYTILELAHAFGGPVDIVEGYPGREDVADDPTRARDELHWEPTVDVMDYIRELKRSPTH